MDLNIEQMGIIFTMACTFLSMILTVISWGVTFGIQKRILEMQALAESHRQQAQFQEERLKYARQAISSLRTEQLNIVKDWFQQGEKIWRLNLLLKKATNDEAQIDLNKQLLDWKAQTGKVHNLAYLIDRAYPDTSCTGCLFFLVDLLMNQDPKDALTTKVNEFYGILVKSSTSSENSAAIDQYTRRLNEIFTSAMEKIDSILTRQLASAS